MYELVGVLIHTGSSANAGHYTAHLRDSSAKKEWWKFDDDHVSRLNPKELGETPASNHMLTDAFGASRCSPSS